MKKETSLLWVWVILACLLIVGLVGWVIHVNRQKAILFAEAEMAALEGDWILALEHYLALAQLDANYHNASDRIERVIDAAIQVIPGGEDVDAEIQLLRLLAERGESERLARVLERCMVIIPSGEFTMGSATDNPDEHPKRKVYLDAFLLDRYEVTNAQYQRFLEATGQRPPNYWPNGTFPEGQIDYPVVGVSWADAEAYCRWASKRLPSEAEWEKSCRGTDERIYPWGNNWQPERGNFGLIDPSPWPASIYGAWDLLLATPASREYQGLQPVGSFPEGISPFGAMDLAGSVEEWVADWYNPRAYEEFPADNPLGTWPDQQHAVRGSAWIYRQGMQEWVAELSRCAKRNASHGNVHPRVGFRCARSFNN